MFAGEILEQQTAPHSENDLCADAILSGARQSHGPNPHELGAAIHEELKSGKPNQANPLPNSSPSSEASSSLLTTKAGDAPPPASSATNSKPDCLKLKDGHCKISFETTALCSECNAARYARTSA